MLTQASRSVGIELAATRHAQACAAQLRSMSGCDLPRGLELICGDMLDLEDQTLADATLVFCYNLCIDAPFLLRLRRHLLARLPAGAVVLMRGKRLPEEEHEQDEMAADSTCQRRLELRLRLTMFYGYVLVEGPRGDARPEPVLRPDLKQELLQLGESRFQAARFVPVPPGHTVTAEEISHW